MNHASFLGHHVHPMLIVFPLGLLATSVAFDVVWLVTSDPRFPMVSFWMLVSGLMGGALAAVFGVWDWLAIPRGTRAKRVGLWHGITIAAAIALFGLSWALRRNAPELAPDGLALACSFAAVPLTLVGGWLGGELVERLGMGVEPGAHPDAPSSLSGPLRPGE